MKSEIIVFLGDLEDLSLTYVKWLCEQNNIRTLGLSEEAFGQDWHFQHNDQDPDQGHIFYHDQAYDLKDISGYFVRLNPKPTVFLEDLSQEEREVVLRERRQALRYFLNTRGDKVVNKTNAGITNASKPYQMKLLREIGFQVPDWITTNDVEEIRAFMAQHNGQVIYKSCSGLRSHVKLVDEAFLEEVAKGSPPVIIQQFIAGFDCRVHVVQDKLFPTKIISNGVDYRFDEGEDKYEACEVPKDIGEMCIQATHKDRLVLSGLDFKVTDQNEWFCLEMNPVPTFIPYEIATRQTIGKAIIEYMIERPLERVAAL